MFKSVFKTVTFKQSQITILGTIINGGLGAIFYILMARFLGPSDFGLFTISIAALTLIADSVDFGSNTGLVKYVSGSLAEDKDQASKFLKLSLEFKILISIIVLIFGFFLSPWISIYIFNKEELTGPLRLVMLGVGSALLFSFGTASLQAFQKYFTWSLINVLTNFLRLIFIFILFNFGSLTLNNSLLTYILLPFFGFSLSLLFLPTIKIFKVKNETSIAGKLFKYNFWVGTFTIIAALSSRLDTFITARLLSTSEVGIYGVANQMVQVIPQLIGALGIVAAPKFSSFQNNKDMLIYFKKFQLFILGLSILVLAVIPVAIFLIPQFFGMEYIEAINPFIVLFLAMIVFLIAIPIHSSIIFYFGRPDIFVWISLGHLIIIAFLGYYLINNFGLMGAAYTVLVGTIFNFISPLIWFLIKIEKGTK